MMLARLLWKVWDTISLLFCVAFLIFSLVAAWCRWSLTQKPQ